MKLYTFSLFLILVGCKSSNPTIEKDEVFDVAAIITELIESGYIDRKIPISDRLKTIEYYTLEYSDDSLLAPPPTPFAKNEEDIIKWVDSEYFPNDSTTRNHIRYQLKYLNENRSQFRLIKGDLKLREFDKVFPGHCYFFYKPIFNQDSSALFLQHDRYYGYFGDGGIHVVVKVNHKWVVNKAVHTWEN
ncbi:hypothetical protein [Algoriphagus taiwanensis]|uniref:Lipoprotein n=1 Tax=Algoriphagus taiwanensis TaxID=1445656 RepID=A0ABQ6PWH7_9BACT|nr:hypothetical protein Ataiwa_05800 [Algoriphagus taiwanensis]